MLSRLRRGSLLPLLGLLGLLGCGPESSRVEMAESKIAQSPGTFSVMTWNLEWFYDENSGDNYSELAREKAAPSRRDWEWRRDAVAARLAEARPTVCAVQEVESRRVLWYLTRSLIREHSIAYQEAGIESADVFTEQDVGFLYRGGAELISSTVFSPTAAMRASDQYYNVAKHLLGVFEVAAGTGVERVAVMNVHLRSTPQADAIRVRQARLLRHWLDQTLSTGENVILLGDFNTQDAAAAEAPAAGIALGEMEVARGWESPDAADDWIDLHAYLDSQDQQTHLLRGRAFDRILVSRSLIEDDPSRPDLVFASVEVRKDLAVQGELDEPGQHWEHYWSLPASERDLSDHFPVLATFEMQ